MSIFSFGFKNIRKNLYDNKPLLAGLIFNISFLFAFQLLWTVMNTSNSFRHFFRYDILVNGIGSFRTICIFSGFFLYIFLTVPYIKTRIREYGLLLILGIRKKTLYCILGFEYLLIWGVAIVSGLLMGLLITLALFCILKYTGFPIWEIQWLQIILKTGIQLFLLSMVFLLTAVIYLVVLMRNKNLSEFVNEAVKPENSRMTKKNLIIFLVGVSLVVLSLTLNFWPSFIVDNVNIEPLLLPFCIIGIYFIISSGMPVILHVWKTNKNYYNNLLVANNICYRLSMYKKTIFAVILIHFAVLYYLGGNIELFPLEDTDYNWRYPHDLIMSMSLEEKENWENICRKNGAQDGLKTISYTEAPDTFGRRNIGISLNEYKKLTLTDTVLSDNEILLCIQNNPEDFASETSVSLKVNEHALKYYVKKQEAKILVMGYAEFNIIVFSDNEFERITKKKNASNVLILQDINKEKQVQILQELQKFKRQNPQIAYLNKAEALRVERAGDRVLLIIHIFCGVFLAIAGIFILNVKFFMEIPDLKRKYKFYRDIGMREDQMRKELYREIWQLIWIPAIFAIILAGIYETQLIFRYIVAAGNEFSKNETLEFLLHSYKYWLFMVLIFMVIQLVYTRYITKDLNKRIIFFS